MVPSTDLSGSWVKVARAKELITDLDELARRVKSLDQCKAHLSVDLDADSGEHILFISEVPNLEPFAHRVGALVGDVIHNLRSALDHLVFALAVVHTQGNVTRPKQAQFPIAESPEIFSDQRAQHLSEIGSDDADKIEKFQPYHGKAGRPDGYSGPYIHQLDLLQVLSNMDKHRNLTTVMLDPSAFQYGPPGAVVHRAHLNDWREQAMKGPWPPFDRPKMEAGHVVARAAVPGLKLDGPTFTGYAIPNLQLEDGRPVVPTLHRITKYVELIVRTFEEGRDGNPV